MITFNAIRARAIGLLIFIMIRVSKFNVRIVDAELGGLYQHLLSKLGLWAAH